MRVLFLLPSLGAGGAENSLAETLPLLTRQGVNPLLACFEAMKSRVESHLENRFEPITPIEYIEGRTRLTRIRELNRLIERWQPEIVHSAVMEANLISRFACLGRPAILLNSLVNTPYTRLRFSDPKTVAWKHRCLQAVDSITSLLVDHFHAVNEAVKQDSIRSLLIPAKKITVVERGRRGDVHDSAASSREAVRNQLGLRNEHFAIITVGRQCFQKGQIYLLQAFKENLKRHPHIRLIVAGREGDSSADLRAYIKAESLQENILNLGHRNDVPGLLAASDLFVFPSLFEGIGGAAIEAMAAGLPVISSDLPGMRETLGTQPSLCFPAPTRPDELSQAIDRLLDDPELRASLGAYNQERFKARFMVDSSVKKMIELYTRLLQMR